MPAYSTDKGFTGSGSAWGGNKAAAAGKAAAGGVKKAGNATVADHMIATGKISVPSIGPGGVKAAPGQNQDDAYTKYARAVGREGVKGFGARVLDFLSPLGISNMPVDSQRPWTFKDGTYHPGWNPGALAGIPGSALFPGAGAVLSTIGQKVYTAAGGHMVPLGGYNGAEAGTPPTSDPTASGPAMAGDPRGPTPKGTQTGSTIPGPVAAQRPAIFGQPQAAPNAMQASIFPPKPPVQMPFQVGGGNPYGFNIFGRSA